MRFFLGCVLSALLASLATIWVVMQQVPALNGWTLPELLLIYGLTIFCRSFITSHCCGIDTMFCTA